MSVLRAFLLAKSVIKVLKFKFSGALCSIAKRARLLNLSWFMLFLRYDLIIFNLLKDLSVVVTVTGMLKNSNMAVQTSHKGIID